MRIVRSGNAIVMTLRFRHMVQLLDSPRAKTELHRGVIDAGRKTKTRVQRAAMHQMALKAGNYNSYVVANTRGTPRKANLSYEIYSLKGGAQIEKYKGLMSVKSGGRAARRMNAGRPIDQQGTVRSSVWNNPRIFKRSFAGNAGFFALRPPSAGTSRRAPKALWTFGHKPGQPRGAGGRFASSGVQYGKVRRLFGPALSKELPQGESLATFYRVAPEFLEQEVSKRLVKLLRF